MIILEKAIAKAAAEQRLKSADELPLLTDLLRNKSYADVTDDSALLAKLNKILGGNMRVTGQAEPDYSGGIKNARRELEFAINTKNLRFRTFCEIGCGLGFFPRAACDLGCDDVCGIDIQAYPQQWDSMRQGTDGKLRFLASDIRTEAHEKKYEMVASFSAFEHFDDPPSMLAAMSELVADGGCLYLNFSSVYNAPDGFHLNPLIKLPWHHLIFSRAARKEYYENSGSGINIETMEEAFNRWSAVDFYDLFANFTPLRLVSIQAFWDLRYLWFLEAFPHLLPPLMGREDLLINGFRVIYKKDAPK